MRNCIIENCSSISRPLKEGDSIVLPNISELCEFHYQRVVKKAEKLASASQCSTYQVMLDADRTLKKQESKS